MAAHIMEVHKFRAVYRYSYDEDWFYLYWKKQGNELVHNKYPLKEMSDELGRWRGHIAATKINLRNALILLLVSVFAFSLASGQLLLYMAIIGALSLIKGGAIIFNEIGFIFPVDSTVLEYRDRSGAVYMFHGKFAEKDRENFEKGLARAIKTASAKAT